MLHVLNAVIATVLSFLSAFSAIGLAGEPAGQPAFDQTAFEKKFSSSMRWRTLGLFPAGNFEISFDDTMQEAFDNMKASSGFDFGEVARELPDYFFYLRWIYNLFPDQFNGSRDDLLEQANEYQRNGEDVKMVLARIIGVSVAMPKGLHFYTKPAGWVGNNGHRVYIGLTYEDGSTYELDSGVDFFPETGIFKQNTVGVATSGFEMNTKESFAYSAEDPQLQRKLRYTKIYDDIFLDTKMVHATTVRLKFDYQGKDWMLQLWKGRYFITSGGEVGLYHKEKNALGGSYAVYDCAEQSERIMMSFRLFETRGGTELINRPLTLHWWMTGFALKESLYPPEDLRLETEVVPTDAEMMTGLVAALDEQKKAGTLDYTLSEDGTTLAIVW